LSRRSALFLDRDGVINVDRDYVCRQQDFEFIAGIFELCRYAKQLGYLIFVVTNQAGIGRGYYTEQDFLALTDWMCGTLQANGAVVDKVYYCPSHPEHGVGGFKVESPDRKPGPGLILRAAKEFDVDLGRSLLVGDKETDIQAGIAAGVGCNLLYFTSTPRSPVATAATAIVSSLVQVEPFLRGMAGKDA
jgi:D-glycero-D-manno-heptose 1,7-bisphosphate phosphatase